MKNWFKKSIARLKQPRVWIAIAIVAAILAVGVILALAFRKPVPKHNRDYNDASQVYFTHFAIAAESNRLLFENGALPDGYVDDDSGASHVSYAYAKVLEVLEDDSIVSELFEGLRIGSQKLLVEITTGAFKGETVTVDHPLNRHFSKYAEPGTSLLLYINSKTDPENRSGGDTIVTTAVKNYDRTWPLILVAAIFLIVTGLVGGKVGLRSILGLAFTLAAILWVLIPGLAHGRHPVPLTLLVSVLVTILCFILLDGLNRKTVSAMLGTIAGFGVAALFAAFAGALMHLDGITYDSQETSYLIEQKYADLEIYIRGLFVSGVIISALGAVMDVAMSISSSVNELKTVNRDMHFKALFKSGMNIGRDAVGTMTNTLILAFAGGTLTTLLAGVIQEWDPKVILSSDLIAHELITGVAGSIGLILAVPLTALIASALCERFPSRAAESAKPEPKKEALPRRKKR
jgi:uncharacterized membrane protein